LGSKSGQAVAARVAAWGAALIYAANPNLIYLQSTAMTEPVYLAFFIWAVVYFCRFVRAAETEPKAARSSLLKCGWCLAGACLSRYDGWFLAGVVGLAGLVIAVKVKNEQKALRRTVAEFLLLAAVAPVFWLAYNAVIYRKPLEFANGPYSAKAIEEKTTPPGAPPHPGAHNLPAAASYFLKAAELNMMESNWGRLWLVLLLAGTAFLLVLDLGLWPLLLLWVQFPFYMLSIAYGGVPIFLPPWWPHSLYNTRYGIELLPAFAAFGALAVYFPTELLRRMRVKAALAGAMGLFIAVSYAAVWRAQPICFREAWANSRTRIVLEQELAKTFKLLPPQATLLMYLGDHPGALLDAGIPLRRLIYEGNHRPWMQPSDPDGLWERALADPSKYADFVVASDGDAISTGVNRRGLTPLVVIHVMGQPTVTIYSTHGSAPTG
jgi:Dolichyl-phosphate-mannose-protein mannosyltransferase